MLESSLFSEGTNTVNFNSLMEISPTQESLQWAKELVKGPANMFCVRLSKKKLTIILTIFSAMYIQAHNLGLDEMIRRYSKSIPSGLTVMFVLAVGQLSKQEV
jgi:hypothetical protein